MYHSWCKVLKDAPCNRCCNYFFLPRRENHSVFDSEAFRHGYKLNKKFRFSSPPTLTRVSLFSKSHQFLLVTCWWDSSHYHFQQRKLYVRCMFVGAAQIVFDVVNCMILNQTNGSDCGLHAIASATELAHEFLPVGKHWHYASPLCCYAWRIMWIEDGVDPLQHLPNQCYCPTNVTYFVYQRIKILNDVVDLKKQQEYKGKDTGGVLRDVFSAFWYRMQSQSHSMVALLSFQRLLLIVKWLFSALLEQWCHMAAGCVLSYPCTSPVHASIP